MTDTKPDVCRVMAEKIWNHITFDEDQFKDETIRLIYKAIRDHTIVPEMVLMLGNIETTHLDTILGAQIHKLLSKAEGRNDG